jgi:hypothetical protein
MQGHKLIYRLSYTGPPSLYGTDRDPSRYYPAFVCTPPAAHCLCYRPLSRAATPMEATDLITCTKFLNRAIERA